MEPLKIVISTHFIQLALFIIYAVRGDSIYEVIRCYMMMGQNTSFVCFASSILLCTK